LQVSDIFGENLEIREAWHHAGGGPGGSVRGVGWLVLPLRVARGAAVIMCMVPERLTDLIGIGISTALLAWQKFGHWHVPA
jgi:hypothetical protein